MQRLNTFFCICFVGVLLVWWVVLREYNDYVNRAGIILNFLSALMVSQDFVGSGFWTNAEEVAERQLCKLENFLNRIKGRLEQYSVSDDSGNVKTKWDAYKETIGSLPILILCSLGSYWWLFPNPSFLLLSLPITFLAAIIYFLLSAHEKKHGDDFFSGFEKLVSKFPLPIKIAFCFVFSIIYLLFAGAVTLAAVPALIAILFTTIFAFLIFYPITVSLLTVMKFIANMLSGNDKLREIVKYWGIIFFLLGNLLQFISTFLS